MPAPPAPRFASALSTQGDTARACREAAAAALEQLGAAPDLALVFVSHHHGPQFAPLAADLWRQSGAKCLLGCTGEAVVGVGREIEGQPAISLWLASLPGVTVEPMHLSFEQTPEGGTLVGWPAELPAAWPAGSALVVLGEPFSFPVESLLSRVNEDQPGVPVVGGMASGGWNPGQNRLLWNDREFHEGALAALVHGPLAMRCVVSQGCRPIGRHYVVTRAERNVIFELGGKPPLAQLQALLGDLTADERRQLQQGLHVGRVINEYQDRFGRGDFLVRNCVGADPQSGAIQIGDWVRAGQTVQFHIRDARTADEDLRELLAAARAAFPGQPAGALLFTCNGRGTRLFEQPHHDAAALAEALGSVPLAGFFAQGELGPIGGKNFIHGFTASAVLFGAADPSHT